MAEATSLLLLDSSKKSLSDPLDAGSSENSKGGQGTPPNALAVESSEADSLSNKEQLSEKKTALVTEEKLPQSDTGGRQGTSSSAKTVRLFGYVEFRGPLKNIPKWQRVLGAELPALTFEGYQTKNMPPAVAERWNKLAGSLKDAPLKEKIQKVNIFFNQWQYKTDMTVWGVEDYWATPKEFIRKSGDCEDYAITKYFALRSLGVPINQMRILAVRERIRGIGHAVLVVFMDDSAYILDNMTNLVLPHTRLTNYEPKFSVNEEYRWAYVKPIAKTK